jgi:hypothetical protein
LKTPPLLKQFRASMQLTSTPPKVAVAVLPIQASLHAVTNVPMSMSCPATVRLPQVVQLPLLQEVVAVELLITQFRVAAVSWRAS